MEEFEKIILLLKRFWKNANAKKILIAFGEILEHTWEISEIWNHIWNFNGGKKFLRNYRNSEIIFKDLKSFREV